MYIYIYMRFMFHVVSISSYFRFLHGYTLLDYSCLLLLRSIKNDMIERPGDIRWSWFHRILIQRNLTLTHITTSCGCWWSVVAVLDKYPTPYSDINVYIYIYTYTYIFIHIQRAKSIVDYYTETISVYILLFWRIMIIRI